MRHNRGLTLIETLITCFLLLLLTGSLFGFLVFGNTMYKKSVTRSSDRQELQTVSFRMMTELRNTSMSTITFPSATNPSSYSFLSFVNEADRQFKTDASGAPQGQNFVVYYLSGNKLLRRTLPLTGNIKLTDAELQAARNGDGQAVATNATQLALTHLDEESAPDGVLDANEKTLVLTIGVQATNAVGKLDEQTMTHRILTRQ